MKVDQLDKITSARTRKVGYGCCVVSFSTHFDAHFLLLSFMHRQFYQRQNDLIDDIEEVASPLNLNPRLPIFVPSTPIHRHMKIFPSTRQLGLRPTLTTQKPIL